MNTIYDLVITTIGTPQTAQQEAIAYLASAVILLLIGWSFWVLIYRLFK